LADTLEIAGLEFVQQLVQFVFGPIRGRLRWRRYADGVSDRLLAGQQELLVAFANGDVDGVLPRLGSPE
jgi:hypothetical protein